MTLTIPLERLIERGLARHAVNRVFRRLTRNVSNQTLLKLSQKESYTELVHSDTKTPLGRKIITQHTTSTPLYLFDFTKLNIEDQRDLEKYVEKIHEKTVLDKFFHLVNYGKTSTLSNTRTDKTQQSKSRSTPTTISSWYDHVNRISLQNMLTDGPGEYAYGVTLRVAIEDKKNGFAALRPKLEALTNEHRELLANMVEVPLADLTGEISNKTVKLVGRKLVSFAKSVKDHEVMHALSEIAGRSSYNYETSLLAEGPSHAFEAMGKNPEVLKWRTERRLVKYAKRDPLDLDNQYQTKPDPSIATAFRKYVEIISKLTSKASAEERSKIAAILSDNEIRTLNDGNKVLNYLTKNKHLLKAPASRFESDKLKALKEEVRIEKR